MIFKTLGLTAFGRFKNHTLELQSGMNIIHGPNEAGKTTIHKFIEGMLYGFKKPGRSRRVPLPELDKYRPWTGETYEGVLVYEHQGRRYRVERRFDPDEVVICDDQTGRDLASEFTQDAATREFDFAERHLGLGRTGFTNTISISQIQARSDAELAAEVKGRLANLTASGSEDVSVQKARAALERELEAVGTLRARTRPLARTEARVAELEGEHRAALEAYGECRRQEGRVAELRREQDRLEGERDRAAARLRACRVQELRTRLERAQECLQEIAALESDLAGLVPAAQYDLSRRDEADRLAARLPRLEEEAVEVAAQLEQTADRLQADEDRLADGPDLSDCDPDTAGTVKTRFEQLTRERTRLEQLRRDLAAARERLEEAARDLEGLCPLARLTKRAAETGEPGPGDVAGNLAEALAAIQKDVESLQVGLDKAREDLAGRRRRRLAARLLGALATLAGTGLVVAAVAWLPRLQAPLGGAAALTLLAAAGLWLICLRQGKALARNRATVRELEDELRQRTEERIRIQQELGDLLRRTGAAGVPDLQRKVGAITAATLQHQNATTEVTRVNRDIAELEGSIEETSDLLARHLAAAGLPADEVDQEAVDEFRARLAAYLETRRSIERLRTEQEQLQQQAARLKSRQETTAAALAALLDQAGLPDLESYRDAVAQQERHARLLKDKRAAERALAATLEGRNTDALKAELERLEREQSAAGTATDSDGAPGAQTGVEAVDVDLAREQAEAELQAADAGLKAVERDIAALISAIDTKLKEVRPPQEVEEERDRERRALGTLKLDNQALSLALEVLDEVAREIHRDFAPQLNRQAGQLLGDVTGGRYGEVRLNEDLEITVAAPETGRRVPLESLSHGTMDQVYFAARVAIAGTLCSDPTFPIILDDSFVLYDDTRLAAALDLLVRLSSDHQILLLTCRRQELDYLRGRGEKFRLVELPTPSRPG